MEPATSPLVVHNASEEEVAADPMIDVNSSMQGMHAEKNIEEMVASDGGRPQERRWVLTKRLLASVMRRWM